MSTETLETSQVLSQKVNFHPAIQAVLDETLRRINELNNSRNPRNINEAIRLGIKFLAQIHAAGQAQEHIERASKLGHPFTEKMIHRFAELIHGKQ